LGLKNLQRVAHMLLPATAYKEGEPYNDLAEVYGRVLAQWTLEMNHVSAIVGGFESQQKRVGQDGRLFLPVARDRQEEAVNFLVENAFATPKWAVDAEILRRIEPVGVLNRIRNAQAGVLNVVLNDARFARLVEQEALDGAKAYTAPELLGAVRKGIWKELDERQVKIDAYRRNLQNAYLDLLNTKVNRNAPAVPVGLPAEAAAQLRASYSDDEKPFYRAELRALNASIGQAVSKAKDPATRAHLEGARDQIARILDPKFSPVGAAPVVLPILTGADEIDPFTASPDRLGCWPNYVILP
jgi:hypothetical protein